MGIYDLYYVSEKFDKKLAKSVLNRDHRQVSNGKTCNHHTRANRIKGLDIINYCCICGQVMAKNRNAGK